MDIFEGNYSVYCNCVKLKMALITPIANTKIKLDKKFIAKQPKKWIKLNLKTYAKSKRRQKKEGKHTTDEAHRRHIARG